MKYCSNCGNLLNENSNFCCNCGNIVSTSINYTQSNGSSGSVIICAIVGLLFPIIGAILYYVLKNSDIKASKTANTCSWIGFLLEIIIFTLTGCNYNMYEPVREEIQKKENSKFTLSSDKGYADEYGFSYYIEGTVTNNTSTTYSYVQVTFNVYDENGSVIGSCWDNINNLEGNGSWKIKAICSGEAKDIKSYKLTGFSSW